MKQSFKMFLILAEELNFCKAANRAYISQQAMSEHIRRLEDEYGPLFVRRPTLRLTQAGEVMRRALIQIQLREEAMKSEMQQIQEGVRGEYTFAMNHTRAQILLPRVFPDFHREFPDVTLKIQFGETAWMEQQLLKGNLQGFLGINTAVNPQVTISPIYNDSIYLILSDYTMREVFPDSYGERLRSSRSGVHLRDFRDLPVILSASPSTTESIFTAYSVRHHLDFKRILSINDFDTQMHLCLKMSVMAICPSMFVSKVLEHNAVASDGQRLHAFPIAELENALRVDLVTPGDIEIPVWMRRLKELILRECALFSYM